MTPEEKLVNVESQVVLVQRGEINAIACPYCQGIVPAGTTFCCITLGKAVSAVLDRQESDDRLRIAEEAFYRAGQEKRLVSIN